MGNKYGIYQASKASCVFYKEDDDGNQSTFNLIATPETSNGKPSVILFIDNDQFQKDNKYAETTSSIETIFSLFKEWAEDAPVLFEMEAQKSMSQCLSTILYKT